MSTHLLELLETDEPHQLFLNGQDAVACGFTVGLLPRDDNHLRVAVLSGQVDLGVGFLPNLEMKTKQLVRSQTWTASSLQSSHRESSTFLMFDPPFPMMFLWNCLKMGTETEKLFSTCQEETQVSQNSSEIRR